VTYEDAEEFLETNKVERGIRNAAEAGAVMFTVMFDVSAVPELKDGPEATSYSRLLKYSGILILSTSRRRNLQLLEETPHCFVPLGVARFIPADSSLDIRVRQRFVGTPVLESFFMRAVKDALQVDPDLLAIVREWMPGT
jgi:hypothetical protein